MNEAGWRVEKESKKDEEKGGRAGQRLTAEKKMTTEV